jgi:hypothetical protein
LKPGAHLLAFFGTRTYHRGVINIEDAGFEIRDQVQWLYGSGFPKSHDVSKGIDKKLGAEGTFGAPKSAAHAGWIDRGRMRGDDNEEGWQRPWMQDEEAVANAARRYEPASEAAQRFDGWGTALKPAHEPIVVARKPLIGTVAENVLAYGVGGLNIDGCRVEVAAGDYAKGGQNNTLAFRTSPTGKQARTEQHEAGRWPANIIHDGSDEVLAAFPEAPGQLANASTNSSRKTQNVYGEMRRGNGRDGEASADRRYTEEGGTNFAALPGQRRNDSGSAARFFYCAKANKKDRNDGLDDFQPQPSAASEFRPNHTEKAEQGEDGNPYGRWKPLKNNHPTVKPTDLMRYLCRLVTPPGGKVLDPFAGSGSTGRGAVLEGFQFSGIEMSEEFVEIARARVAAARKRYEDEVYL